MGDKSEKSSVTRSSGFDAKDVKTSISDKSYEQLSQEAQGKEISKAELVRHLIYEYQEKKESKKESSQSKTE
jgi:hypothetical protein